MFSRQGVVNRPTRWMAVAPIGALAVGLMTTGCGSLEMDSNVVPMEAPAQERVYEMAGRGSVEDAEAASDWESDNGQSGLVGGSAAQVGGSDRKLVFTAYLELIVEDVWLAVEDARRVVDSRGGFVEVSEVYGDKGSESARMTLRVPQEAYDEARKHLRGSAVDVVSEQSARTDVTRQYVDLAARLENMQSAEEELREILTQARETGGTTEDVLAIHSELTRVRGDIESLQAQKDALSEQVALSTIEVTFSPVPAGPSEVVTAWRPGMVFRRAQSDLAGALKGLIDAGLYFSVAVLPILVIVGLIVGAAVVLARAVVRRLRGAPGSR